MIVKAIHKGDMAFEITQGNHNYFVDAKKEFGGTDKGPSPKGLLLSGLIGCTGMDTVSILKKMHIDYNDFTITAETELTEEHPKVFKDIYIIYNFEAKDNIDDSKLIRAVDLSMTKYCGVSAMLVKNSNINYMIKLNGEEIYASKKESL